MVSPETTDVARRARQFYEQNLRPQLEATNRNDFVAIEPDSGEYFCVKSLSAAIQAARRAHPDCLVFALRIGHNTAVNIGVLDQ